jgi:hypothetical protein
MMFDQISPSRRLSKAQMSSKSNYPAVGVPHLTSLVTCLECLRPWADPSEHWSLYVADDLDAVELHSCAEPMAAFYCPQCAAREFGGNRRGGHLLSDS